jgi:hypothetical protein
VKRKVARDRSCCCIAKSEHATPPPATFPAVSSRAKPAANAYPITWTWGHAWLHATAVAATSIEAPIWLVSSFRQPRKKQCSQLAISAAVVAPF